MEKLETGEIEMEDIKIVGYCDLLEEEKEAFWEELKWIEDDEKFWENFAENFNRDFDLEETERYEADIEEDE